MDEEGLIHRNILAARSRGGAFESMALGTESKRIPGSGFETLGADVPVQDAAEAAGRCAALGRPEIEPGTTRNHHPRSPTAQAGVERPLRGADSRGVGCAFSGFADAEQILMVLFTGFPLGKRNSYKSLGVARNMFH